MPLTVPLIARNLCFWCVEAFRECPIHENSKVFWNDVSVKNYSDESDGFRIVEESELINVERNVLYSENGGFILPPNGSTLPVSAIFHFEKLPEKEKEQTEKLNEDQEVNEMVNRIKESFQAKLSEKEVKKEKSKETKKEKEFKKPKVPKEKIKGKKKNSVYGRPHKNAIKSVAKEYKKGKKCDESQKVFLCDICEFSFTLRHNLQSHLVQFHGKTENVTEEKVALLKQTFPRKEM